MLDILLVDDDATTRRELAAVLAEAGHHVVVAGDAAEALARLDAQTFQLVISDVRMPKGDGFGLLRRVQAEHPGTDVLLMTAYGSVREAVAAVKEHAVDYLEKPFDVRELLDDVAQIDARRAMEASARVEREASPEESPLLGRTPVMLRLREQIEAIGRSEAAVLITGESGTGKELVARLIHDRSARRDRPFVPVNCAAIPPTLIEAELFGHEKGAFTGAVKRREGRFQSAHQGTLFLDEIGDMSLEAQVKLLRVLEEGAFEPVGSDTSVHVDVRVISATNRDLRADVERGGFRQDLLYRIRVFELRIPPLRERRADVPVLVERFLRDLTAAGQPVPTLSPAAWAALGRYEFPGNVRELMHAVQHGAILAGASKKAPDGNAPVVIDVEHLPPDIRGDVPRDKGDAHSLTLAVEQYEREHILRTLELAGGERNRAAAILGTSRKTLWKKMKKYGLSGWKRRPSRAA